MEYLLDTFSGAAGTLLENHSGPVAWIRHGNTPDGSIQLTANNRIRIGSSSASNALYYVNVTPETADYTVEVDYIPVAQQNGRFGILARMSTSSTGAGYVAYHRTGYGYYLGTYTNGAFGIIVGPTGPTALTSGQTYNFKLRCTGTLIEFLVDDVVVLNTTSSTITSIGRAAVFFAGGSGFTDSNTIQMDNFSVFDDIIPSPDVEVRDSNNNVIADNGTAYNLGNIGTGSVQTVTFTVTNIGSLPLTVSSVTPGTGITVTESLDTSLGIDESDTFTVQITSSTEGTYNSSISIASDDLDSPFVINITANVVEGVPPAVPTGLATQAQDYQTTLTWNANTEPDFSSYRIYRSTNNVSFTLIKTVSGVATTSVIDSGLNAGTTYYYKIAGRDINNNESAQSSSVSVVPTGVPTPQNFIVTNSNNSLTLTWDSVPDSAEYRVWANGVRVYTGTSINPTISGLQNGIGYDLRLSAVSAGGTESPPAFALGFPTNGSSAPNAPSNCTSARHGGRMINIAWDRTGVVGETGIILERNSSTDSTWRVIANLQARHNQYQDNVATTDGTTYQYRVRAAGPGGASAPSSASAALAPNVYAAAFSAPTVSVTVNSAFQITVSYTNPTYTGGGALWWLELSENDGLAYYTTPWGRGPGTSGSSGTYIYPYMKPGTRCRVRVFIATGLGASEYGYSQAFEMPTRPGPLEPTNITYDQTNNSSAVISWTDTNSGLAQYEVEVAPIDPNGSVYSSVFTTPVTTSAGATSATITLTPERGYFVRVRALQGGQRSGYGPRGTPDGVTYTDYDSTIKSLDEPYLHIITPIYNPRATPLTFNIGPGQPDGDSFEEFSVITLQPGDTLRIHCNTDGSGNRIPYRHRGLMNIRGLPTKRIRIVGIPHPITGERPLFNFTNATSPAWTEVSGNMDANSHNRSAGQLSGFYISSYSTGSLGYMPGFFNIEGLEMTGCEMGEAFTYPNGTAGTYSRGSAPFRFRKGSHVIIQDCVVHGNGNGCFGTTLGNENSMQMDITLKNNHFYDNGTVGFDLDHHTYFEGLRIRYEGNYYGPLKPNTGSGLKDRSAGAIIRYNWLEDGGHQLDLCESQDGPGILAASPWYNNAWVYGNVFAQVEGRSNSLNREIINTHDDHNGPPIGGRSIYFRFYYNTIVVIDDRADYVHHASTENTWGCVEFRNNVMFSRQPASATTSSVRMVLGKNPAFGYTGRNWLSPGHGEAEVTNTGRIHGYSANTITTAGNAVGFVDQTGLNFRLLETSPLVGQATNDLPPDYPSVQYEIDEMPPSTVFGLVARSNMLDIGAFAAEVEVPPSLRDSITNLVVDSIDNGTTNSAGRLQLLTAGDVILVSIPFSNPAFGDSEDGTSTVNTFATTTATGTGIAAKFRFLDRNNAIVLEGTVSDPLGNGDMTITNPNIASGDRISLGSGTYTGPEV